MAGNLATFLQNEFPKYMPYGWNCQSEAHVLPKEFVNILGYSSRVDLLLGNETSTKKLWIEFEVSRADPVANHAKFATSHLFQPQEPDHIFVSMISSHVTRGRRNLAANSISLMREVGMNAFQTALLPQVSPAEIKRINHLSQNEIALESLNIKAEIERIFSISESVIELEDKNLHFAGDFLDVFLNLRQWNQELTQDEVAKEKWGQRTITYFVFDPYSKQFAPSKFCAYSGIWRKTAQDPEVKDLGFGKYVMTVDFYVTLDGVYSRFDGRRARMHLTKGLGMTAIHLSDMEKLEMRFDQWLRNFEDSIRIHPRGPIILIPPAWFK
jgi:hypothetical protein